MLGEYQYSISGDAAITGHLRGFRYGVAYTAYYPMGWIECRVRGEPVILWTSDGTRFDYVMFDPP